jgi:hypothetical protein
MASAWAVAIAPSGRAKYQKVLIGAFAIGAAQWTASRIVRGLTPFLSSSLM